jgi:hypothetical protein
MFCVNCGKHLIANSKFCGGCGRSIEESKLPEPTTPIQTQRQDKIAVPTSARLLASVSFTALFVAILRLTSQYAGAVDISIFETIYGSGIRFNTPISFGQWFETMALSIMVSVFVAWRFMPGIVSDCKNGLSLKVISGRVVTLTVCIIPALMFLRLPHIIPVHPFDGEIMRSMATMPNFILRLVLFCIVFAPLLYKAIITTSNGKPTRVWTILVLAAAVILNLALGVLGGLSPVGGTMFIVGGLISAVIGIIANIIASTLTVLLSIMVITVMRSFKKAS